MKIVKKKTILYSRILCTLWFSDYTYNQNEVYFLLALSCIGSFTLPSYEYWEMMQRLLFIFLAWKIVLLVMDKDEMMPLTSGTVSLVPTLHFSTVQFIWKKILIASIAQHHSDPKVDTPSDVQNINTWGVLIVQFLLVQFLV